jgi:hypothetical protein
MRNSEVRDSGKNRSDKLAFFKTLEETFGSGIG